MSPEMRCGMLSRGGMFGVSDRAAVLRRWVVAVMLRVIPEKNGLVLVVRDASPTSHILSHLQTPISVDSHTPELCDDDGVSNLNLRVVLMAPDATTKDGGG